jgi:hypothetical protein
MPSMMSPRARMTESGASQSHSRFVYFEERVARMVKIFFHFAAFTKIIVCTLVALITNANNILLTNVTVDTRVSTRLLS